jgi:CRISPR-associated endonuclease Cas1
MIELKEETGLPTVISRRQALTTHGGLAPMAATQTVPQLPQLCNFVPIKPEHGVVTLFGYNSSASVDRGHLVLNDGIGMNRRYGRLPRVRHGLKRLVVIGSTGMVTFEALRWLSVQDVAFVLLDRDGTVLAVSGPVGPSDARLRRAQSLAHQSGVAVQIARELISQKLEGQEKLARDVLKEATIAQVIASFRSSLHSASSIQEIRQLESQAAQAYWSAWRELPINFPTSDLIRVPQHWKTFGTRKSPITGSPRLAVNPANGMLNYMYALLESEARLAAASLGLDPGLGFLHADTDARDSLACDLMEPGRPQVDAFLLDWIIKQPLRRDWFFEQRDGSCRLMASFAVRLSESAPAWRQFLAPITEWVSKVLWSTVRHNGRRTPAPTHLTQSNRRDAKGLPHLRLVGTPHPPRLCKTCGAKVTAGYERCASCKVPVCTDEIVKAARTGRLASHSSEAEAKRAESRRKHVSALRLWQQSDQPAWLDERAYLEKIQPRLVGVTVPAIRKALSVSKSYATNIRAGKRLPHPRHWKTLVGLTGVTSDD